MSWFVTPPFLKHFPHSFSDGQSNRRLGHPTEQFWFHHGLRGDVSGQFVNFFIAFVAFLSWYPTQCYLISQFIVRFVTPLDSGVTKKLFLNASFTIPNSDSSPSSSKYLIFCVKIRSPSHSFFIYISARTSSSSSILSISSGS